MKTALLLGFATAGLLYGGEPVVVEPLGLPGHTVPASEYPVVGGQPIKFGIAVQAPAGAKISLVAHLSQVGGDLVAPLQTHPLTSKELDFPAAERRELTVEIPLPEVKRPSTVLVDFQEDPQGPSVGRASFLVFPKLVPGEPARALETAEKSGGTRLAIFGQSPALRAFFRDQKITFEDLGAEFPRDFPSRLLVLGEVTATELERRRPTGASGRAIFFTTGAWQPRGVYQTTTPEGSLTKVTLPILSDLADNPQNQALLLDLLKHQLDPATAAPNP